MVQSDLKTFGVDLKGNNVTIYLLCSTVTIPEEE